MKRIFIFLAAAALTLFATVTPCYAKDAPAVSAQSAILVDLEGGVTLFEKNADKPMGPASTTKIMTALTVLRYASPDDTVTVSPLAVGTEGSSVYLCEGERLTVEQLLYALLLSSANDAAVALAVHVSRDVNKFVGKMNDYAAELGLKNTHFVNPHGLSDTDHYTTAYDLALISCYAMKNDDFREIVGKRLEKMTDVAYAFQEFDALPEGYSIPEGRVKPWGTGHAVYAARNVVKGPFVLINADDFKKQSECS